MSEARSDGTKHAGRKTDVDRTPGEEGDGRDEILRTERGGGKSRPAADRLAPTCKQDTPLGTDGGRHPHGPRRGLAASGPADEVYGGWLPTGVFLTPGEALAAVLVAEVGWGLALVVLVLAERLTELPEPLAEHGFAAVFLCGLVCGLYVLLRLRSRRLAWRRHLKGEP